MKGGVRRAYVPKPYRPVVTTQQDAQDHRVVFLSGVVGGTVHRQPMRDGAWAERTVCGGWVGSLSAVSAGEQKCPVCYQEEK